jgi:hypothetical protein
VITPAQAQALSLQLALAGTTLCFGVLCLRVAPRPGRGPRSGAWYLAGVAFTLDGAIALVHNSAAVAAVMAGPGSAFYARFLALTPPGNDARGVLMLAFAAAAFAVVLRGRPVPRPRIVVTGAAACALAGFAAGFLEPPLDRGGVHFTVLSVVDAAAVILLFAALYRGLLAESLDWLLWSALAVYAVQQAMSSDVQVFLAWAGVTGSWAPPHSVLLWTALASVLLMLACTARRLALARDGLDAPALLERLRG